MFHTIVVGTDGSPTAREAVRRAAALARLTNARLHVVIAYGTPAVAAFAGASGYASEAIALPQQREDAESMLQGSVGGAQTDGLQVTSEACHGEAADVLLAAAQRLGADLIVVGSRGMTGARRFFLGSVPNRVAHRAECAVHIVHTV